MKFTASDISLSGYGVEKRLGQTRCMAKKPRYRRTFIRHWRTHRNLTLQQLAERVNMTPSYLSMLERSERGYTQETLEALADALSTDAASLLMRNPLENDAIWSIWDQAKPGQRAQIVEVLRALVKTGT